MEYKLITHGKDLDGISCIIVLHFIREKDSTYDFSLEDYKTIDNMIIEFIKSEMYKKYDKIFITDIGISEETAKFIDNINNGTNKFTLIDHHDSNSFLNKYSWANVRSKDDKLRKISAAKLFFQMFKDTIYIDEIKNNLEKFINDVSDYDTYIWKDENNFNAKGLHNLLAIYKNDLFIKRMTENIENDNSYFTEKEQFLLEVEKQRIENYIKEKSHQVIIKHIQGYRVGVVFAEMKEYISELGNYLCKKSHLDIAAMISIDKKEVSYRTLRDDIDLGNNFANIYGGGGHPKAAGNLIDERIIDDLIKEIFKI